MDAIKKTLRDSAAARWLALLIISLVMFAAYVTSDIFAPLQTMLEENNLWNSIEFGWFAGSYSIFNVFLGMLIFGGFILDKKGVRFTGMLSCVLMVIGIAIKYYAITCIPVIDPATGAQNLGYFVGAHMKKQVIWVVIGFGIFGVGSEVAGITVSKIIVKWFKGKEMAMAMGLQLALARLGSALALMVSPLIAAHYGNVSASVMFALILLGIALVCFFFYCIQDKRLDKQLAENKLAAGETEDDAFSLKDVKAIVTNPGFWLIAFLCLIFYAAVSPFYQFGSSLMVNKFGVAEKWAGAIPAILPFGCIILTPLFGRIYDKYGHGADLMIFGAVLITGVHLFFALPFTHAPWIAIILMILLGIGFAMLPSAMWPSLAKIIPEKQFGTAMALTYYIQNIGLWGVPMLIGWILNKYCILSTYNAALPVRYPENPKYNYVLPMLTFAITCSIAIILAFCLKSLNGRKHYGLQEPNIKAEAKAEAEKEKDNEKEKEK